MTAAGIQNSPPGALVLATGIAAVTLLGARDSGRRSAPD
jgi:hypothetical protein